MKCKYVQYIQQYLKEVQTLAVHSGVPSANSSRGKSCKLCLTHCAVQADDALVPQGSFGWRSIGVPLCDNLSEQCIHKHGMSADLSVCIGGDAGLRADPSRAISEQLPPPLQMMWMSTAAARLPAATRPSAATQLPAIRRPPASTRLAAATCRPHPHRGFR